MLNAHFLLAAPQALPKRANPNCGSRVLPLLNLTRILRLYRYIDPNNQKIILFQRVIFIAEHSKPQTYLKRTFVHEFQRLAIAIVPLIKNMIHNGKNWWRTMTLIDNRGQYRREEKLIYAK
jgi:hypothetical protein